MSQAGAMLFDPLNHYDYWLINTFCECQLCLEWRLAREAFAVEQKKTGRLQDMFGHTTAEWRESMMVYTAISLKRDLYCEMSFHAAYTYSASGREIMEWVAAAIADPKRTPGWWTHRGVGLSIDYWVFAFKRSCIARPVLSLPGGEAVAV